MNSEVAQYSDQSPSHQNESEILKREWLETDGLGGYACGTVGWARTRRQHSLFAISLGTELRRYNLLASVDIWVELRGKIFSLSGQYYTGGVIWPDNRAHLIHFNMEPWPTWTYDCDKISVKIEAFMRYGQPITCIGARFPEHFRSAARVIFKPYLAMRGIHEVRGATVGSFLEPEHKDCLWTWRENVQIPGLTLACQGDFEKKPEWCGPFFYEKDSELLQDSEEILYSPGVFICHLRENFVPLIVTTSDHAQRIFREEDSTAVIFSGIEASERERRNQRPGVLIRAMECYLVRDQNGPRLVAGYPWLGEEMRDTLISLRGLCLTPGLLRDSSLILGRYASKLREQIMQDIFSGRTSSQGAGFEHPDIPLWYVISMWEVLTRYQLSRIWMPESEEIEFWNTAIQLVRIYSQGIHPAVKTDSDGLIITESSSPGWGGCTALGLLAQSRRAKYLLLQLLWINSLWVVSRRDRTFSDLHDLAQRSFEAKFWDDHLGVLLESADERGSSTQTPPRFRGEQILAIGGLPKMCLRLDRAVKLMKNIENKLLTPLGLRSLDPDHPDYVGCLEGDIFHRSLAFGNGAVWPWLLGPYVEAWIRIRGNTDEAKLEARQRFLSFVSRSVFEGGLGHLPEICDGDEPHTHRGCPFYARAVSEIIRLREWILKRSTEIKKDEGPILRIKARGFEI